MLQLQIELESQENMLLSLLGCNVRLHMDSFYGGHFCIFKADWGFELELARSASQPGLRRFPGNTNIQYNTSSRRHCFCGLCKLWASGFPMHSFSILSLFLCFCYNEEYRTLALIESEPRHLGSNGV